MHHPSSSSSSSSSSPTTDDNNIPISKTTFNTTNNIPITSLPLFTLHTSSLSFFKPTTHLHKLVTESSNTLLCNIHSSIDKCFTFLHLFASKNPFFTKLQSFCSEYHSFCQINYRNQRNLRSLSNHEFAAIIPGDSVAGLVVSNGVLNFLNIYNTLLVVSTLCDPYLNIFRGVIPPLGGTLDLSPILAFLVLNALTSTASALPAELPSTESSKKGASSQKGSLLHTSISHLTSSQKKWMKRLNTKRSKDSGIDE